jgi:hypothetical protein
VIAALAIAAAAGAGAADPPSGHDYPTVARVEYVQECVARNGGEYAYLYKCSCVIDRIAERLDYDQFVETSTFARYATLPGEGGGIFRDTDDARKKARLFRDTEAGAYKACGITARANTAR